jgi:hypothetical protein
VSGHPIRLLRSTGSRCVTSLPRVRGRAPGGPSGDDVPHPRSMAPVTTPPAPGSMTVPPLFGWEVILVVLVVLVVVAVAFVAFGAMRSGRSDRTEWQAWLDTRSGGHRLPTDRDEPSVGPRAH